MGPRARDVLAIAHARRRVERGFPVRARAGRSRLPARAVLALRVTYVGELGWELHVPVEFARTRLRRAHGGRACRTASPTPATARSRSLRLEKAYRAWGSDIGPDHTPLMAGLGWAVKLRKNIPFLGREALEAQRAKPLPRLLAGFTVDDPDVVLLGRETIYRNGKRVGWLASRRLGLHDRARISARLCARCRPASTPTT